MKTESLLPRPDFLARPLADRHREAVNAFNVAEFKIAYLSDVLDAQVMIAEDTKSWPE
jgi:hypothetical protein